MCCKGFGVVSGGIRSGIIVPLHSNSPPPPSPRQVERDAYELKVAALAPKVDAMEASWNRIRTISGAENSEDVIAYWEGLRSKELQMRDLVSGGGRGGLVMSSHDGWPYILRSVGRVRRRVRGGGAGWNRIQYLIGAKA